MAFFWGVRISSHGNGASLRTIQKYLQEFMASVCFVFFFCDFLGGNLLKHPNL